MAKELLIVFVYDCERCQREEDDPQEAVVYFYPSWVSEQQRLALCGQLMGVSQFLNSVFSSPNIMALQTGKFALKSFGRYILCVGTDRNIPDLVLEKRITTLYSLLRFYHLDFETVKSKSEEQFPEKLNQIFETYLPILQYSSNVFGVIPTFNLPKSASSVFLEAIQVLQCFQDKPGVMGGVLLHQNKVVATQLDAKLTKLLVVSDPYRIKLPAESIQTQFRLPVGVQLLSVYVAQSEAEALLREATQLSSALKSTKQRQLDSQNKEKVIVKPATTKEPMAPPVVSMMKRDVSRIFTVPEEAEVEGEGESEAVPDVVRDAMNARRAARLATLSVTPAAYLVPDPPSEKRAQTTDDIPTHSSTKVTIRYLSLGVTEGEPEWTEGEEKETQLPPYYNTLADPTFPLFRRNGLPASGALYDSRVARHYRHLSQEKTQPIKQRPNNLVMGVGELSAGKRERAKRALNLPLGSITTEANDMLPMMELGSRKPNMTIPLTPLMAKLSLLAMERGGPGGDVIPAPLPTPTVNPPPKHRKAHRSKGRVTPAQEQLQESVLYVCGYQDMTLLLLMDTKTSQDPDQIHSLWQTSVSSLNELEGTLHHCLEHFPSGGGGSESYSYLSVDPQWGTVCRGGPWAGATLELLTTLHHNFNTRPHLTETIVRSEDSIIYGYQCGGTQVYYQQPCGEGVVAGLPAPSDPMGVVSLKAKRRLERDHGIVLL